jgi:heme oxygenase
MPSRTSLRTYLIDLPSPLASADEWRAFLADLEGSEDAEEPDIRSAIQKAEAHIAALERVGGDVLKLEP